MIKTVDLPLDYYYGKLYAIVIVTDDRAYNNNECELLIIDSKESYKLLLEELEQIQPYTGKVWKVIYKKAEK